MSNNIKLFNPYHDRLGRFATKNGKSKNEDIESKEKSFFEKNKKTLYTVGGIAIASALVAATAYGVYSKYPNSMLGFGGKKENSFIGTPTADSLRATLDLWNTQAVGDSKIMSLRKQALEDAIFILENKEKNTFLRDANVYSVKSKYGVEGVMVTRLRSHSGITNNDGKNLLTYYVEWLVSAPKNQTKEETSIKGAGTYLLKHAAKEARSQNKTITLNSSREAIEYYKKLGFVKVLTGLTPNLMLYPINKLDRLINMEIDLSNFILEEKIKINLYDEPGVMAIKVNK